MDDAIQPHPDITDPIESERCPTCGTPGIIRQRINHLIVIMACPVCDQDGDQ